MVRLGNIWNAVKRGVGQFGDVVKRVGSFVAEHHKPITQLAHGIAMASGNETAQKLTGMGLALSNIASMRQGLNKQNQQYKTAYDAGGTGVFNASTGQFSK